MTTISPRERAAAAGALVPLGSLELWGCRVSVQAFETCVWGMQGARLRDVGNHLLIFRV